MNGRTPLPRAAMRGITLIELLIVVVIIGILAAVAYPSYQEQVAKSRRSDGKAALLDTAQRLERCYTRFSRYDHTSCTTLTALPQASPEGFYEIRAVGTVTASVFRLRAVPLGAHLKTDKKCGVLRLSSSGQQGSLGLINTDANNCW